MVGGGGGGGGGRGGGGGGGQKGKWGVQVGKRYMGGSSWQNGQTLLGVFAKTAS